MRYFLLYMLMLALLPAYAEKWDDASDKALVFEIIQNQYSFNNADIKDASIIEKNSIYTGLLIHLKPAAAAEFQNMTKLGVGKHVNFIFNKKIVSSAVLQTPLGDSFLVTGISKEEALAFITMLNDQAKKKAVPNDNPMDADQSWN